MTFLTWTWQEAANNKLGYFYTRPEWAGITNLVNGQPADPAAAILELQETARWLFNLPSSGRA